jgi:hypothetical protein
MKERPILFNGPMVRAILAGSKTQTRRVVKPQPDCSLVSRAFTPSNRHPRAIAMRNGRYSIFCPYGAPGDRLWVRETWLALGSAPAPDGTMQDCGYLYRASVDEDTMFGHWKPSIHMPRAASRITLEITGVRVERLQEISEGDIIAEGCPSEFLLGTNWYRPLWESINGKGVRKRLRDGTVQMHNAEHAANQPDNSWDANPFVWVVEFRKLERGAE